MFVDQIEFFDTRSFVEISLKFPPLGTTVLFGPNGSGKTTILEGIALLSKAPSFTSTTQESLIRRGAERAVLRARFSDGGAQISSNAEISIGSKRGSRKRFPLSIFSPSDPGIVQGGPSRRRDLFDSGKAQLDLKFDAATGELQKILRQRAALLRGGTSYSGLEVWDIQLVEYADYVTQARRDFVLELCPLVQNFYQSLARDKTELSMKYELSYEGLFRTALKGARREDLRRGVTTIGPHRDDIVISLGGRDARMQASQGEQRSIALALRLALHECQRAFFGSPPPILLDDVFSELDAGRSGALLEHLPVGQCLLTTAQPVPGGIEVSARMDIADMGKRVANEEV